MMQDPNKDIQKPSVKEKLARSSAKKKVGVGEMGKPDFKSGFEAAMQKERNTVLNRAKERDKDPDWYKKEAIRESLMRGGKENLTRFVKNVKEEDGKERLTRMVKDVREEDKSQDVGKFNDWYKKHSIMSAAERGNKNALLDKMNSNIKTSKLKSMSKHKLEY